MARRSRQSVPQGRSRVLMNVICFFAGGMTAAFIFFSAGFAPHVAHMSHGLDSKPSLRRVDSSAFSSVELDGNTMVSGSGSPSAGGEWTAVPVGAGESIGTLAPQSAASPALQERAVHSPPVGAPMGVQSDQSTDPAQPTVAQAAVPAPPASASPPPASVPAVAHNEPPPAPPAPPTTPPTTPTAISPTTPTALFSRKRYALINTYDTHSDVVATAHSGGPSGEIVIRNCLQQGLEALNFEVHLVTSLPTLRQQCEHPEQSFGRYSFIVLDENSIGGDGQLEPCFRGLQDRVFFLDFFGMSDKIQAARAPAHRVLTPYPYPDPTRGWAKGRECERASRLTFLGYFLEPAEATVVQSKRHMAVVWGKEDRYLSPRRSLLARLGQRVELHTTSKTDVLRGTKGVVHHGFVPRDQFMALLRQSRVFIGLGDPLVGPAALEALAAGNVLVNPTLRSTKDPRIFTSQQPFLEHAVGAPHVCTVDMEDAKAVEECVEQAMEGPPLGPYVPPAYTREEYMKRLTAMLETHLTALEASSK
mmetsp:Transcript_22429/g.72190  ORF Transcript_22429/g.72190 Transcript_22429/m.72190 type:complete len:532 (+) Transcript_22429:6-1601(+)